MLYKLILIGLCIVIYSCSSTSRTVLYKEYDAKKKLTRIVYLVKTTNRIDCAGIHLINYQNKNQISEIYHECECNDFINSYQKIWTDKKTSFRYKAVLNPYFMSNLSEEEIIFAKKNINTVFLSKNDSLDLKLMFEIMNKDSYLKKYLFNRNPLFIKGFVN